MRNAYVEYLNNIENKIKENPRGFWYFIIAKSDSSVSGTLTIEDRTIDDPQDLMNNFASPS